MASEENNDKTSKEIQPVSTVHPVSEQDPEQTTEILHAKYTKITGYEGPLPHPEHLAGYGNINPTFPDRIVKMAESEIAHRHNMEEQTVSIQAEIMKRDFNERKRGQRFGLTIGALAILCGTYAIVKGYPVAGGILSGTCVVGLVTAFIVGRTIDDEEDDVKESENLPTE